MSDKNPSITNLKYDVMQIKSFTNLIVKQLESVHGDKVPEDGDFRETLHSLVYTLAEKAQELDEEVSRIHLSSVYGKEEEEEKEIKK